MARLLGISPTKHFVFLSLLEDGVVVARDPLRMPAPNPAAGQAALVGFLTEFTNVLGDLRPERVGVMLPETIYQASYDTLAPRAVASPPT